ncbi:hypothetical protein AGOR_G00115210 [Albula goreensis]|uniref:Uncharacterized protein n=1 Tax=Albula goreensis TaxID=1534307 RepID=A0A8T3DA52_9TELE|nr:hypothetical protein AGOR_G00115210 [Albula goreensis]
MQGGAPLCGIWLCLAGHRPPLCSGSYGDRHLNKINNEARRWYDSRSVKGKLEGRSEEYQKRHLTTI